MTPYQLESHIARRAAHERARQQHVRVASVPSAHGALYSSLRTGILRADDHLDETTLVPLFSVSRNAVRTALRLLADEGIVTRVPHNGTVVVSEVIDVPVKGRGFWGLETERGRDGLVITDQGWVASTPMTRRLLHTDSDQVHLTEMIDLKEGKPGLIYTRFSIHDGSSRPIVARPGDGDFATMFEAAYGSKPARIDCWVEAIEAGERCAARLGVAPETPLLVFSRVFWGADGQPYEYTIMHYVAAQVVLTLTSDHYSAEELTARRVEPPAGSTATTFVPGPNALRRRSSAALHAELRAAIRDELFSVGDRLDEDDLAVQFAASRNTVRTVLAQLVEEGLVRRSRRDGTVLTSAICDYTLDSGMPYPREDMHRYQHEQLAAVSIPTPPFVAELLQTESATVTLEEFLGRRDGRPMTVQIRYVESIGRPRPLTTKPERGDFTALFEASYGVRPGRIDTSLHAVRADEQTARRLSVQPGTVLLLTERLVHDADGRPRELSHSYHIATHISLASHISIPRSGAGAPAA